MSEETSTHSLIDCHCHLDFAPSCEELGKGLFVAGVRAWSATVQPFDFAGAQEALRGLGHEVGLGFHPWWVLEDSGLNNQALDVFDECAASTRLISEVGLDSSLQHAATQAEQQRVFHHIVQSCNRAGSKVFSLHAVKSACAVCSALETSKVLEHSAAVFHWFSGSSDDLQRALRLGCYFSVGERMLNTKRGRAYVQALPLSRLLLETDFPSQQNERVSAARWRESLCNTARSIAALKGVEKDFVLEQVQKNAEELLPCKI